MGRGGGLNREGGLINFPPLKRGGLFERGGLIEDLRYFIRNGNMIRHFFFIFNRDLFVSTITIKLLFSVEQC